MSNTRRLVVALCAMALSSAALWSQIGNIVVTDGAAFQPGLPAAGSIATIFCTGLTVTGIVAASSLPLPYTLAGVTVTIGGAPAPLFAVADLGAYQQINFQVPLGTYTASGATSVAQVVVAQNGVRGSTMAQPGEPQFFLIGGTHLGVFQHASDSSLVTEDNPAVGGETLVGYLTGFAVVPSAPTGQPAPPFPLSCVPVTYPQPYTWAFGLHVGNGYLWYNPSSTCFNAGAISFFGLTPGSVGLEQVNFVLPQGLAHGDMPIQFGSLLSFCVTAPGVEGCQNTVTQANAFGQAVMIPVE